MELTKEQQDQLAIWKEVVLDTIINEDSLLSLISKMNHERQVYIAQNKEQELALNTAKLNLATERFLDLKPQVMTYFIAPASADTIVNRMLDPKEPVDEIMKLFDGMDAIVAMILRRKLKKAFYDTRVESVRFRMEYFNSMLKGVSNDSRTMDKRDMMSSPTHFSLTSTIRQQQSDQLHNELNEQLLRGIRKL